MNVDLYKVDQLTSCRHGEVHLPDFGAKSIEAVEDEGRTTSQVAADDLEQRLYMWDKYIARPSSQSFIEFGQFSIDKNNLWHSGKHRGLLSVGCLKWLVLSPFGGVGEWISAMRVSARNFWNLSGNFFWLSQLCSESHGLQSLSEGPTAYAYRLQ